MSKKLLLGLVIVLIITNVASLLFWNQDETITIADKEDKRVTSKEPVASINGEKISYKDWTAVLQRTYGEKQLKTMIDKAVVKQLAKKNKVKIPEKIMDRELALLTSMQGVLSKKEMEKRKDLWREDIRYRYQLEALLTKDKSIDEQKVKEYYNIYKNQYDFKSAMQLSHIVVQNEGTAKKVEKELQAGASFDLLAKEYSIDGETKKDGGYLGFITTTSQFFPNGYEELAKNMDVHSFSKPFKTDTGYAIIYLHQKLPAIKFTYDEIKPYVKSELALQELDYSLTADPLWDKLDIEWVYEH